MGDADPVKAQRLGDDEQRQAWLGFVVGYLGDVLPQVGREDAMRQAKFGSYTDRNHSMTAISADRRRTTEGCDARQCLAIVSGGAIADFVLSDQCADRASATALMGRKVRRWH